MVEKQQDADVIFSVTAWTNESASIGPEMRLHPDCNRVVIIDERDQFNEPWHK